MNELIIDNINETVKILPEKEQEIIEHLSEIFEGEEEKINEYIKNELL